MWLNPYIFYQCYDLSRAAFMICIYRKSCIKPPSLFTHSPSLFCQCRFKPKTIPLRICLSPGLKPALYGISHFTLKPVILILVAESEFVLDFPAREVASYVDTPALPTLKEFSFCFWMKRGFDGQLYGQIISYATTQEVFSLGVFLGHIGALNLRIMDPRYSVI